jgi:fatty acid desaturase
VLIPALSGSRWRRTLAANVSANLLRNLWAYVVIFCGHFPDGAEKFTADVLEHETRPEWYLRQMLGAANFKAGRLLAFSSGNLCYQIEHHLFPDLPSNRYAQIAVRVRALCDKYDLPYTSGSLVHQYLLTPDAADHPQTRASRRTSDRHVRRRTRNRLGTQVRHRRCTGYPIGRPDNRSANRIAYSRTHTPALTTRRLQWIAGAIGHTGE